jgi:hypothetical protein
MPGFAVYERIAMRLSIAGSSFTDAISTLVSTTTPHDFTSTEQTA